MRLPAELRDIATYRRGVLTIRQLRTAGVRSRLITATLRDGHWQRATSAVVVMHALAIDRPTWLWVASVHFDGFVLAGTSALELEGLPVPNSGRIHLLGQRGGQTSPSPTWTLHTSRAPLMCATGDGPPASTALAATADALGVYGQTGHLRRNLVTPTRAHHA